MDDRSLEKIFKNFDRFLDRVTNPETEGDYANALEFWIRHAMYIASSEYRTGWANIIELGTEVDIDKVIDNLDPKVLKPIIELTFTVCQLFDVALPYKESVPDKKSFQDWFEQAMKNDGKVDFIYPDFIFEKISSLYGPSLEHR